MNKITKRFFALVMAMIFALSAAACSSDSSCIKCGKDMGDGNKFCPHCGSEQITPNFICSECGRENAIGDKYCGGCGKPLAQGGDNTSGDNSTVTPPPSSDTGEDTYDPAGEKVLLIRSGDLNSWHDKYYYDYNGNEIRHESYANAKKMSVVERFYDEHGNLKKKVTQDYDDNEYTEITYTNTYDENGNLLKSVSSYDGSYNEYIYNSDGLLETKVIYLTNYYTKEPYKFEYIKYFYDDGVLVEREEGSYGDNDEMTPTEIFQNGRLTYQVTYQIYGDGTNYLYEYIYTENSTDVKVVVHTEYESHKYNLKNCNCDKNSLEYDTAKCDKYGNLLTSTEGEYMTLAEYREKGLYSEQGANGTGSNAKCLECNQAGYNSCIGHKCDQCGGDGKITCSACHGSGVMAYSPLENNKCIHCYGDKTEICPNNHCKAGKIFYN